jgi:Rho GDP-dissociation inhibitor
MALILILYRTYLTKLSLHSLSLESEGAPNGKVSISLDNLNATELENLKKQPLVIKEGVEYNVAITFR